MIERLNAVIRGQRVMTPHGEAAAWIGIRDGEIVIVGAAGSPPPASDVVEYGSDVVVMPGMVDSHVHVCDPGTDWEGFETATRAAAAGGITTLIDMPIDSFPATLTVADLETKRQSARGSCHIDVGFWGGAVPGNLDDMPALANAGVFGFKGFMIDPGIEGFPPLDPEEMEKTLAVAGELTVPLLIHAETSNIGRALPASKGGRYVDYLASRPREMENRAIAQVIEAVSRTGGRAHIVHLSSSDAVPMIASARRQRLPLTVETCPHYLTVAAEEIPDGATGFKCSPPIREGENRDRLWQALADGTIGLIASDHAPCTVAMKQFDTGDFGSAWGGIASLQLSLPLVWTEARRRGHSLGDIARWMAEGPARLAGLRQKGKIAPGYDADFCVIAPDASFVVSNENLFHRNPVTPYIGRELFGVVRETWLRGERVDPKNRLGELLDRHS